VNARREAYAALFAYERVDPRNPAALELWTELLDVYVGDVVMAVAEVGNAPADVLEYLLRENIAGSRSRTPERSSKRRGHGS